MRFIVKLITYLASNTISLFVTLIPKNKKVWVFGAWFGNKYSDNSKYLFEYVSNLHYESINAIWIAKDRSLIEKVRGKGYKCYYYKSLKGIYYQSIAKAAFVGHSISTDLNATFIGYNTLRVQLWHGMPMKKIGFDDHKTKKNFFVGMFPKAYSYLTNDFYNIYTSNGRKCTEIFVSSFGAKNEKIFETGFPRNDVFYKEESSKDRFKVIYMPTYRSESESADSLFEKFDFDLADINRKLEKHNIELTIRLHPKNTPNQKTLKMLGDASNFSFSTVDDIYEEINEFDCLITDYSSIVFDFYLSRKTILYSAFDIAEYLELDREMYFHYSDVTGENNFLNWKHLIDELIKVKSNNNLYENAFLSSCHFQHSKSSDQFSKNVADLVISQINR